LTQWHLRKAWYLGIFSSFVYKYEKIQYSKADVIIVQSEKDRHLVKSLFSCGNVELISPSLSKFIDCLTRSNDKIETHSVLFWGALNRSENSSAIIWFLENCWSKVTSVYSDAKLYIVGMNPGRDILAYSSANIIVTGYVDDPSPYFERVLVGIAPLFQGAGVKVKVLEMLKAGIPVVSTEIGAEGIESNANLKMADKNNFSCVLIDFLSKSSAQQVAL
jgi:glycosyltransferase involved in cell wall biosynthesis